MVAVSIITGLAACADDPASPGIPADAAPGYPAALNVEPVPEFDRRSSFDLDVSASGSFRPGHPVHLTFTGKRTPASGTANYG
ncbi:MAG TPA: hypothetical protein VHG33_11990 [Woeseiaceae bacterium]|nr:hypothetical protein [Woeseiaceae bacterium]